MKIEVGKFYKTRSGTKVKIISDELTGQRKYVGIGLLRTEISSITFNENGLCHPWRDVDDWAIVSEWIDLPPIDWSVLPAWAEWVAMDEDGEWWWYIDEPKLGASTHMPVSDTGEIPPAYAPKWNGDFRKSKVQRPKK